MSAHVNKHVSESDASLPKEHSWRKLPVIAGAIGVIAIVVSFALGDEDAYSSYLVAYAYFLSIALGGLFFTLVQFASRAGWSTVVRRLSELVGATLPVFLLLFIPILIFRGDIFHHWMHYDAGLQPGQAGYDSILAGKTAYLNDTFFIIRAVFYLLVWAGLGFWYLKQSTEQDKTGDKEHSRKMAKMSYPGLILFAGTLSFAAFDWLMSLDPHWFSTMFGVYYFAGTALSGFAILAVLSILLKGSGVLQGIITVEHEHDLGKFTFAFTVFWTYIAFSQFMLIWYAHIPEETGWFKVRMSGDWSYVSLTLLIGHFVLPFFFLMSRWVKRGTPSGLRPGTNPVRSESKMNKTLLFGCLWMLAIHFVDMHWLVKPVSHADGPAIGLHDITTLIGVGGVFVCALSLLMSKFALVPYRDPRLDESLNFKNM